MLLFFYDYFNSFYVKHFELQLCMKSAMLSHGNSYIFYEVANLYDLTRAI